MNCKKSINIFGTIYPCQLNENHTDPHLPDFTKPAELGFEELAKTMCELTRK